MPGKKPNRKTFNELRKQAEDLFKKEKDRRRAVFDHDPQKVFNELEALYIDLETERRKYVSLYEFAPVGYLTLSSKGVIFSANQTFADLLSEKKNDLIKKNLSTFIHPDDRMIYHSHIKDLSGYNTRQICELRFEKADGTEFFAQLESIAGLIPQTDQYEFRIAVLDISRRRRHEELLKHNKLQLETILNHIDASIYITDIKTNEILFINNHMKRFFDKDLIGNVCWKSFHTNKSGPCEFCTNDKLTDADGNPTEPYVWEHYNEMLDKWYELHDMAIPWTNGNLVRLEIASDITDRKNAEKEQEQAKVFLENKIKERTSELEEMNAALRVLLRKREEDKDEIGETIYANYKFVIAPIIENLKKNLTGKNHKEMLDILDTELENIVSPFSKKLSDPMIQLTPTEIKIANLIKFGKSNKEISEILNSSVHTISRHRESIRKKTGLKNKKINLRSFLLKLQ